MTHSKRLWISLALLLIMLALGYLTASCARAQSGSLDIGVGMDNPDTGTLTYTVTLTDLPDTESGVASSAWSSNIAGVADAGQQWDWTAAQQGFGAYQATISLNALDAPAICAAPVMAYDVKAVPRDFVFAVVLPPTQTYVAGSFAVLPDLLAVSPGYGPVLKLVAPTPIPAGSPLVPPVYELTWTVPQPVAGLWSLPVGASSNGLGFTFQAAVGGQANAATNSGTSEAVSSANGGSGSVPATTAGTGTTGSAPGAGSP